MPRGRPPISRTKEEALTVRREQIRKNVQAFRRRKQAQDESDKGRGDDEEGGYTFVPEELEPPRWQRPPQQEAVRTLNIRQRGNEPPPTGVRQEPVQTPLLPLAPLIDNGPASLQQFTSNVAYTFPPGNAVTGAHWSQVVPRLVNRDRTLDLSIQALCLLQIGYFSHDDQILPKSLIAYHRALKSLQSALVHSENGFKLEIFISTMALGTYELVHGTSVHGRGWMLHFEGGIAYMKVFSTIGGCILSHRIAFHFLETICVFDALGSRKASCFSTSRWWKDSVDRFGGEAYGPLLRMVTTLPGVVEECDHAAIFASNLASDAECMRLLRLCLRLEDAFLEWFKRTMKREPLGNPQPGLRQSTRSSLIPSNDLHKKIDSNITFPDFYSARLYLLYWSSIILLYDSITTIFHTLHPSSPVSDTLAVQFHDSATAAISPRAYIATSHAFACFILRSVDFCLERKHGVLCKSLIILPLHVARNHFKSYKDEEQARLCEEQLGSLGQKDVQFGLRPECIVNFGLD